MSRTMQVTELIEGWIAIGFVKDIPRRGARRIFKGNTEIAIFRTMDDRIYAIEDKCPHKNGPLSEGIVHDGCVTCPLHNWVISLETGKAQGADEGRVRVFRVKIGQDSQLFLNAKDLNVVSELDS